MKGLVSIITVNHNGKEFLEPFIDSANSLNMENVSIEIIVVDNISVDGSASFIISQFPEVKIIENDVNSYAKALNLGIKSCKGDYIAILNSKMILDTNWFKGALDTLNQDKKIGAVQSKILLSDKVTISSVGVREIEDFYFEDIGQGDKDTGNYDSAMEIKYFGRDGVILKRACEEDIGEFDEDLVSYMENIDYSIRCRNAGWKLLYSPKSIVYRSDNNSSLTESEEYFYSRNRLLLLGKHFPMRLASSIKTSKFFQKNEQADLKRSLLQAAKKMIDSNNTDIAKICLDDLEAFLQEEYGSRKVFNFFSQLEIVLGLRKIRIGIYDHAFYFAGGGQKYIAKIAEILQDRYDITFITNKDIKLDKYREWFGIDLSRCRLKIIKLPFYEKWGGYFIDEDAAIYSRGNPFDSISKESANYDVFINANMLSKVKPMAEKSVFICHFPDTDRQRFFAVDLYDYIVTNSDYGTFWLKKKWGLDTTLRLYPPVDMYPNNDEEVKKEKIIISVARFEDSGSKKQMEMVRAFRDMCKIFPTVKKEWKLILAGGTHQGNNPYFNKIKEDIGTKDTNIELVRDLEYAELRKLYRRASIFWHACGLDAKEPHLVEHFGMTTVEAMQNYCVPIVIDGGGQKEIVEHGISGFRFKNIMELKEYTLKIIEDGPLREEISISAYNRSHCFTLKIFEKNIIRFIMNVENYFKGGELLETKF